MSVSERIQQLEALVRSMAQQMQTTVQTPVTMLPTPSAGSPSTSLGGTERETPRDASTASGPINSPVLTETGTRQMTMTTAKHPHVATLFNADRSSAALLEPVHSHGVNYVSSVHWAAVLDSISELKDQYDKEEAARVLAKSEPPRHASGPRLLYEPVHATKADILATIPARPVVDRMIARYFNAQGVAPGT